MAGKRSVIFLKRGHCVGVAEIEGDEEGQRDLSVWVVGDILPSLLVRIREETVSGLGHINVTRIYWEEE